MNPEPAIVLQPVHDPRDSVGQGVKVIGSIKKAGQKAQAGQGQKTKRQEPTPRKKGLAGQAFGQKSIPQFWKRSPPLGQLPMTLTKGSCQKNSMNEKIT